MSTPILDRTAPTEHPVLEILADRWSPRAFDAASPPRTRRPLSETVIANA